MKLLDIAKTVGSAIISTAVPGGPLLLAGINELLPDDKKLPPSATGQDVQDAVASLPPEQQAAVINKEFDVDLTQIRESNETLRAMLASDAASQHTTRPYIAKHAFHMVAFVSVVVICLWAYGVAKQDEKLVTAVMNGWPFVLAVIAPFVVLLRAYFGVLKQEQRDRINGATGTSTTTGAAAIISGILGR